MPDVVRTVSALQALFANNNNENISPQDLRDFLISAHMKNVTTTSNDYSVIIDANTTLCTITLPDPAAYYSKHYQFKAINALVNEPRIITHVDGGPFTFSSTRPSAEVVSDGSTWRSFSGSEIELNDQITTVLTVPADFTTTVNTVTCCNQTVTFNRGGYIDVLYKNNVSVHTGTAISIQSYFNMNINGTVLDETRVRVHALTTTTRNSIPILLTAVLTFTVGNISITVLHWPAAGFAASLTIEYQKLKYTLYDW